MQILKPKLYRITEKAFKLKKNSLKKAFTDLKERHGYSDEKIKETIQECVLYCQTNKMDTNQDFLVAFNLYVSCLNIGGINGSPESSEDYEKRKQIFSALKKY